MGVPLVMALVGRLYSCLFLFGAHVRADVSSLLIPFVVLSDSKTNREFQKLSSEMFSINNITICYSRGGPIKITNIWTGLL